MTGKSQNWPSGEHKPAALSSRPAGVPANGASFERPVTFWTLLDAFRRRWIPALAVAIPCALLVAGLLWQAIPAKYESTALLRVHQFQQHLVYDQKGAAEFKNYRDTQINLIRSRPVLTAALRVEGVRECRLLADKKYPVEWLEEKLEVESDISDEFIRISLAGEYPEDLALVVNAVKDVYLDQIVYSERNERRQKLELLKESFRERDEVVRRNQERISRLAEELGTGGDPKVAVVALGILQENLRGLQADLRKTNAEIREEEALQTYLKEHGLSASQLPSRIPGLSPQAAISVLPGAADQTRLLQNRLLQIRSQIAQFRQNIRNPNHPDLLALQRQEKALTAALQGVSPTATPGGPQIAMSRYEWLLKQRQKLEEEIRRTQEELDVKSIRIVELEKEKKGIQHLVETRDKLAEQIANTEVELLAPQRVTIVQDANIPEKRDISLRVQASVVGAFGTFGLIVAGFTMFEWFSHRVASTSDIASVVNLRLVGTIPSPDKGGMLGLGIFAGKVDYDEWNRAVIESMDVVRTFLMRHIDPSRPASILITSASANEGKTTVSCQLAASLARSGKRVAVVDCDFRRPSAHLMLNGDPSPGICDFLRGEASLKEIQQPTQATGLTFIPAGQVDQTVLQRLSADGGRAMIAALKEEFDFVVIDTSPLLFVAEPSMLAQNADMVLLSTRKDYSRIPYVAQSRDSLRSLQVPLLGAIMVGADSDFQRQTYGYRQEIQRRRASDLRTNVTS